MADIDLIDLFKTALKAADPFPHIGPYLPDAPKGRVAVVGAGKATARMALAVEDHYPDCEGVIAVPAGSESACERIETLYAAHPVPDRSSQAAAERLLATVSDLGTEDLLIALFSGGGSALLAVPEAGLTLRDKQTVTRDLLNSGASISQINTVRRALSAIKGGKLAEAAAPCPVLTLIVSDVPGDDPAAVASGPTIASPTSAADAAAILTRFNIDAPKAVQDYLSVKMLSGEQSADSIDGTAHIILRGNDMLAAAEAALIQAGETVVNLGDAVEGDAKELATSHAALLRGLPPDTWLISGGESTVSIAAGAETGTGGRNTEYLLALALALEGEGALFALACDSDGIDGHAGAAGAVIGPDSISGMREMGINPLELLQNHDSASAFDAVGALVRTGPTGTNLNDFRCARFRAGTGAAVRL